MSRFLVSLIHDDAREPVGDPFETGMMIYPGLRIAYHGEVWMVVDAELRANPDGLPRLEMIDALVLPAPKLMDAEKQEVPVKHSPSDVEGLGDSAGHFYQATDPEAVQRFLGDAYEATRGGLQEDDPKVIWYRTNENGGTSVWGTVRPGQWVVRFGRPGDCRYMTYSNEDIRHLGGVRW